MHVRQYEVTANSTDDHVYDDALFEHTQRGYTHSESLLSTMKGVEIQELQSVYICASVSVFC